MASKRKWPNEIKKLNVTKIKVSSGSQLDHMVAMQPLSFKLDRCVVAHHCL